MAARVCFVVNPIAGVGGPLALKGSDGEAGIRAVERGAKLVSPIKAERFVEELIRLGLHKEIVILTAWGVMGSQYLSGRGVSYEEVYKPAGWPTRPEDTVETVSRCCRAGVDLIVFVGGDGTARDVYKGMVRAGCGDKPILGVPAGVKVYSSVFAESPRAAAHVLADWLAARALCSGEIVDIDEEAFRRNELRVKLYAVVKTPCSRYMVGASKQPTQARGDEEENMEAIARYVAESMEECTLYILGPGTTVAKIAEAIGARKTLLGVDVVHNGRTIAEDVDEETLYRIVSSHIARGGKVKVIVSPIGGQGYLFGRGNQQISPRILKLIGRENIIVVATRSKLSRLKKLRVDTGDEEVDSMLRGYIRVVVDYGEEVVMRVE